MVSYIQHKNNLTSTKIPLKTRIMIFEAYVSSIFLYNSEVWTLTKSLAKSIDVFSEESPKTNTRHLVAI